jgi:hypothetical protein
MRYVLSVNLFAFLRGVPVLARSSFAVIELLGVGIVNAEVLSSISDLEGSLLVPLYTSRISSRVKVWSLSIRGIFKGAEMQDVWSRREIHGFCTT